MKKYIMGFITGLLVCGSIVYAATSVLSTDVTYDNSESGLESTNVQDALDELFEKVNGGNLTGDGGLITFITNLFDSGIKTSVSNGGVSYNCAREEGMINDRLGNSSVDINGGNIRYYGANPNNYIYFNCSDYSNQTADTCELWRIIGLFKDITVVNEDNTTVAQDLIKIAHSSTVGSRAFNSTASANWGSSSLKTYLNTTYYNALKNDTTRNIIENVKWNLGGIGTVAGSHSNDFYIDERGTDVFSGNATEWNGKIALMYPSDYGYATDFYSCTTDVFQYSTSGCYNNDWLHRSGYDQWALSPYSDFNEYGLGINSDGAFAENIFMITGSYAFKPALYLNSMLGIDSEHVGSSSDPYQLVVNS